MRMHQIVLAQQIFPVVVPIGRSYDGVDMIANGDARAGRPDSNRELVVELDEDHRAMDAVIIDALTGCSTDPSEMGLIQMPAHLVHLYPRMPLVHVVDIQGNQSSEPILLGLGERGSIDAGILQHQIVLKCLADIEVTRLIGLQHSLGALIGIQRQQHL